MSIEACAELVRAGDPDRFLSAMTAPPEMRDRLMVLYAFNLEISRAPWVSKEPMIAEMRLQFWADVIEDIGNKNPPRAHEVAGPLAAIVAEYDLPLGPLAEMVQARRFDIYAEPHANDDALNTYIRGTSGNLMWLAARSLGAGQTDQTQVMQYGSACGLAALLRAYPALKSAGRPPLDRTAQEFSALAKDALQGLDNAVGQRRDLPKSCQAAFLAGWQARSTLVRVIAEPSAITRGQLESSEFSRRGRLLWKTFTGRW